MFYLRLAFSTTMAFEVGYSVGFFVGFSAQQIGVFIFKNFSRLCLELLGKVVEERTVFVIFWMENRMENAIIKADIYV